LSSNKEFFDLTIIGSGIVGSSTAYILSKFTDVNNIAIFDKNSEAGKGNSDSSMNSKTLHEGFAETNYTIEKVLRMKLAGKLFRNYFRKIEFNKAGFSKEEIFSYIPYFVLAIEDETSLLEEKFTVVSKIFPEIKMLNKNEIYKLEPALIEGRNKEEKVEAFYKEDGISINFGNLAKFFIRELQKSNKNINYHFNEEVISIKKSGGFYEIKTRKSIYKSKVVFVASSANSFYLARKMGFLEDYSLVNVRGNYFVYPAVIKSKVYRIQIEKIPFVKIHADPNPFLASKNVEFGPTAELVLSKDYSKDLEFSYIFDEVIKNPSFIRSVYGILADKDIRSFLFKNILYRIPKAGKALFVMEARKIIPKLKNDLLVFKKGGIRPQIVDNVQRKLILGEKIFIFDNLIFAVTPSPGASASLLNAIEVSSLICKMLDKEVYLEKIMKFFEISNEDLKFMKL